MVSHEFIISENTFPILHTWQCCGNSMCLHSLWSKSSYRQLLAAFHWQKRFSQEESLTPTWLLWPHYLTPLPRFTWQYSLHSLQYSVDWIGTSMTELTQWKYSISNNVPSRFFQTQWGQLCSHSSNNLSHLTDSFSFHCSSKSWSKGPCIGSLNVCFYCEGQFHCMYCNAICNEN